MNFKVAALTFSEKSSNTSEWETLSTVENVKKVLQAKRDKEKYCVKWHFQYFAYLQHAKLSINIKIPVTIWQIVYIYVAAT